MPKQTKPPRLLGHSRKWIKGVSKKPVLLPDDLRALGKNIEARRMELKLTQDELAKAAGVSARTVLNIGAPGLGFLMAAIGLGSLSGALAVAVLRRPRITPILAGAAVLGACSVLAGVVSGSGATWAPAATGAALFLAGFGAIAMAASANSTIQVLVPAQLRGRVMSVYTTVFAGSTPVGALATGLLVAAIGAPGALQVAGILALLAAGFAAVRWRALL